MADATVTAQLVPVKTGEAISVADLTTAAAALVTAGLDAAVVEPGLDLVVSVDVTHSEAGDADGSAGLAAIEAELAAVGLEVFSSKIEADPTLSAPADVTLDISDADSAVRTYTVTLSPGASIASLAIDTNEIPSGAVVISRGNPQGHESQKSSDNTFDLTIGPAVAGDEVGSPHNLIVEVTDSNGRTVQDTIAVTVQA